MDLKIKKFIIDSKFRRETSNFKVNFDASSVEPSTETPVLIKHIEKNLKPEEFLGMVVTFANETGLINVVMGNEHVNAYTLVTSTRQYLYYVPSTGALSLNAPYVEEEEGEDDDQGGFNPGTIK